MLSIEMLPAQNGDCLWIEYGTGTRRNRILIDGGTIGTEPALRRRIEDCDEKECRIELLIVTHIDSDHIAGILKLLANPPKGLFIKEAWFNAYPQITSGLLGPLEGEFLTVHFKKEEDRRHGFWNGSFGGKAVCVPQEGALPTHALEGDMKLTVLAPGHDALAKLRRKWKTVIEEYDMEPGSTEDAAARLRSDRRYRPGYLGALDVKGIAERDFEEDRAVANGSSIVVLAEYGPHRCLFAADGFPGTIESGLRRLPATSHGRVKVSVVKVPHHGSAKNNSNDLYQMIDCPRYLISTNGMTHNHPDEEGIARILLNKKGVSHLYFNYKSPWNDMWEKDEYQKDYTYVAHYPEPGKEGLRLVLE